MQIKYLSALNNLDNLDHEVGINDLSVDDLSAVCNVLVVVPGEFVPHKRVAVVLTETPKAVS